MARRCRRHSFKELLGNFEAAQSKNTSLFFWYGGRPLSAQDHEALDTVRSVIEEAYQMCHGRGAKFVFAFIPTKFRVYHGLVKFERNAKPIRWVINELPQRLDTIVRESLPGAGFIDLTLPLRKEAERGTLVYFDYDTHWSPEGHRVAANAIAEYLKTETRATRGFGEAKIIASGNH
jgi:hypothetical protein